jgi:ubiquinone/menaquinone biosynthesis C-methylase UbiE
MTHQEALSFIQDGINPGPFHWADLGAGSGVFSKAIAEILGHSGQVYALDKSSEIHNIQVPEAWADIHPIQQDFTKALELPLLDGIIMANSLHYVFKKTSFLRQVLPLLKPSGRLIFIEYDTNIPNPWVPYPLSFVSLKKLCLKVNLAPPKEIGRRSSRYGQAEMYAALVQKN